jgi:hypothetical protein
MSILKKAGFLLLLGCSTAWAADPFWLEGRTDDRYEITVYRSATCGCCKGWIEHLRAHDFSVKDVTVDDVNKFKLQFDVPAQAASCHTAVVNGLVVEGHVPAQDIKRALAEQSDIRLLAVPAMPSGSPGMDTPGAPKQDFNVYSVDRDNNAKIYRSYRDY